MDMANSNRSLHSTKTAATPAILLRNFVAHCSTQLCMSHIATLLHKRELTNQRSPHFCKKVAQNTALLYSKQELRDC